MRCGSDLCVRVKQRKCSNACKSWSQRLWNSSITRCWKFDHEEITRRCFREFWKERGLRARVLVLRENVQRDHDNDGRSKRGFKCKCHMCGKFGLGRNSREAQRRDTSTLFSCEELQVLCRSECSKGERKAPRCVVLVRESEKGRDAQSVDMSRDVSFPCCY